MNNEQTHEHDHDHEHHQGRSIISRQPHRPPPCEADDNEAEAAARQQDEAHAQTGEGGHAEAHGHAGEGVVHAHDERQHGAKAEEHAHDAHAHGAAAATSSPDEHRQAGAQQFPTIECAVITVSDTRTELDDKSGAIIQSMLQEAGHEIVGYRLVKNNAQQITQALTHMLASRARFVMLTGGTGPGTRDITVETVQSLLEKELTGFGELFRILSYEEIGAATILSRATAGRIGNKFVVCCPGSSGAVRLALNEILIPELAHILREMNR